jgi:hypothetical protein
MQTWGSNRGTIQQLAAVRQSELPEKVLTADVKREIFTVDFAGVFAAAGFYKPYSIAYSSLRQ